MPAGYRHSLPILCTTLILLGACIELAHWPGGQIELESPLFDEADCITATGHDETLASIQTRINPQTFHRIRTSRHLHTFIRICCRGPYLVILPNAWLKILPRGINGCLSPHLVYVERGGAGNRSFAEIIAEALDTLEPRSRGRNQSGRIGHHRVQAQLLRGSLSWGRRAPMEKQGRHALDCCLRGRSSIYNLLPESLYPREAHRRSGRNAACR